MIDQSLTLDPELKNNLVSAASSLLLKAIVSSRTAASTADCANVPLRSCMSQQKQEIGWLAKRFGDQELPLQVCRAASGIHYIGTLTPEGEPYSRESAEYWPTREAAEKALKAGRSTWTQRPAP
jgi:hypothetical protein